MDITSVYQYFDNKGRLLYVGITSRHINRMIEHAETKTWWPIAIQCHLEHYSTRSEALEREEYLIKTYRPPYNTVHNPEARTAVNEKKRNLHSVPEISNVLNIAPDELKRRQRAWYDLPKAKKRTARCVGCESVISLSGPLCGPCKDLLNGRSRNAA